MFVIKFVGTFSVPDMFFLVRKIYKIQKILTQNAASLAGKYYIEVVGR